MLFLEKLEQKRKYIMYIMTICILLSVIYSILFVPNEISSKSTLLLLKTQKVNNVVENKGNLELTESLVANFEEIIKSDSTISAVKNELKIVENNKELNSKIAVKKISNSDTFEINVKKTNVASEIDINKEIINVFTKKVKNIYADTEVYIVDAPHIEEKTNVVQIIITIIYGILSGILINIIYLLSLLHLDKNIKNKGDIESELSLKILGQIPIKKIGKKQKNINSFKLIAYENKKSNLSKEFKKLRSNIQFVNVNNKGKNTILITSPQKEEGKSFVSANIAISFAEVGKKVVLIDADMVNGKVSKLFNVPNNLGLSNFLSGLDTNGIEINERINKFINESTIKNLNIITSGTIPPNSAELLSTPKLKEMIKDLSVFYDVVILDGTSTLISTDALILTRVANSTILVSDCRKTKKDDLWRAKRDIQNVGGRIIGVIINNVKMKENISNNENRANKLRNDIKESIRKLKSHLSEKKDISKQKLLEESKVNKTSEEKNKEKVLAKNKVEKEEVKQENIKNEVNKQSASIKASKIFKNIKAKSQEILKVVIVKFSEIKEKITVKIKSKLSEIEDKNIQKELAREEARKEELAIEKINLSKEIIKENSKPEHTEETVVQETAEQVVNDVEENKEVLVEKENKTSAANSDDTILVIVDPENGFCRVFNKYCFSEKLIRGIDKEDGFFKAQYSSNIIKRKRIALMSKYELSKEQVDNVDILIYTTLCDYDDRIWLERKMISNKAETYVKIMTEEYKKTPTELQKDYIARCQYLRKIELLKAQIEIDYKIENLWKSQRINLTDKITINNFAKIYGVNNNKDNKKEEPKQPEDKNNTKVFDFVTEKVSNIISNIKFEEVKAKSVRELEKEINDSKNVDDYAKREESYNPQPQNQHFVDEYELEEQLIREEQARMLYEQKIEQERIKQEKKEKKLLEKNQKKEEHLKKKEERRKNKELKKEKAKQEAKIEEELLEDNLYPKTKNNKDL